MKARRSADALEWICDMSGHAARITAVGSGMLLVENHRGLAEFSPERIVLATGCGSLTVEGRQLHLEQLRRDALTIRGEIQRLLLPCGKEGFHGP